MGEIAPDLNNPIHGVSISIVVAFQYFMIVMILLSLSGHMREMFFLGSKHLQYQLSLAAGIVVVFMVLQWTTAIAGPYVGAALTFCDAIITAYFAVLLGWNIGKSVKEKLNNTSNWVIYVILQVILFVMFGGVYFFLGLDQFPIHQQIILLIFPLGIIALPVMTLLFRERNRGPDQTSLMTIIIFVLGLYYTFRLVNISEPQQSLVDLTVQALLMIYGLSTTVAKVNERINLTPTLSLSLILFVILSRVGTYVNRLLAAATSWGSIVQIGTTSFIILNLVVLGLIVPTYWMWQRKRGAKVS